MRGKILSVLFLLVCSPCVMLAAGAPIGETDFYERLINFLIFVAIIYYFTATPIKRFFKERRSGIASSLEKIQEKLQASKDAKAHAKQEIEIAKKNAEDVIATAKKEALLITQKIEDNTQVEIENLIRQYNEMVDFEYRKCEKEIISEILDELFEYTTSTLDQKTLGEILLKKVA